MMTNQEQVSLKNIALGAAIERFDDELKRVLDNILDPNTDEGAREVKLSVKITPAEDRSRADVIVSCTSKVAGPKPVATIVYLGKDRGAAVAYEYNPEQLRLNLANKTPVRPLGVAEEKKGE